VTTTSQVHSNISTATAISPPAILCILLNALLFLLTGFTAIFNFQKYNNLSSVPEYQFPNVSFQTLFSEYPFPDILGAKNNIPQALKVTN
jgi:hypothetical protein